MNPATPGAQNDTQSLPVELVAFNAVAQASEVVLTWATASETNNAGFAVEVGTTDDGRPTTEWASIGWVPGHGTTTEAQQYTYTATHLTPGRHRFRLKQVDYDGHFEYSPEIEVAIELPGAYHLAAPAPNPTTDRADFALTVARTQHVTVAVLDVLGRRVALLRDGPVSAETAQPFTFNATGLPAGLYVIHVHAETFTATHKLIVR